MTTARAKWTDFFTRSLAARLSFRDFKAYTTLLAATHPLPPADLADIFLSPTPTNDFCLDMRVPRYLLLLLDLDLVSASAILGALRRHSTFRTHAEQTARHGRSAPDAEPEPDPPPAPKRWAMSFASDETLFYRLAKHLTAPPPRPAAPSEPTALLREVLAWLAVATAARSPDVLELGPALAAAMAMATAALATLLLAVVEDARVQRVLARERAVCKRVAGAVGAFVPLVAQGSPQSAARLEMFCAQTLGGLGVGGEGEEKGVKGDERGEGDGGGGGNEASKEIDRILDGVGGHAELELEVQGMAVVDLPVMNSRAGLYVYLNALLVGRPLIDDTAIFGYLHNRYQGDLQTTTIDLILASFDILANATYRNEKKETITILRSFLINKVPLLISTLSASFFPPLTSEYCITEALSLVDTNVFPTLMDTSNMFADSVRQDFCFACCLRGLLEESSIETLLGDIPMQSLPAGGRYIKEDLFQQCLSDPEKTDGMIDELEHMDGNVGAVSQAITEVIGRLCSNKETMSLKTLCNKLARKPICLDIMLLFDKPITILQPICDLLDNWHYDDDQGEYQPVYEEFGSILLLVLSFTHRYNLSPIDMGIRSPLSFTTKLLNQGHLSRAMENLTEQEQNHLDGWIRGLFDNESGGLGDELMSSCPPQDFYLLVPTLFHHIVLACSTNNLSDDGLKNGLEYLIDTFLLPSLIPGITWLSSHLWESRGDANAVLQILSALITAPESNPHNPDAAAMLSCILATTAKPLEHSLRWLQRAEPTRQDVEPLSKTIRAHLGFERRGAADHTELETWTGAPLTASLRATVQALVNWGLNPGAEGGPAPFSQRQVLAGLRVCGARRVLGALLEEVRAQTEVGNGSVVLDVVVALVCAPEAAAWDGDGVLGESLQRRLTLREVLGVEVLHAPKIWKTDAEAAEGLVRLWRRVEAQGVVAVHHVQPVLMGDLGAEMEIDMEMGADLGGDLGEMGGMGGDLDMGAGMDEDLMSGFVGVGGGDMDAGDLFGDGGLSDGMGF